MSAPRSGKTLTILLVALLAALTFGASSSGPAAAQLISDRDCPGPGCPSVLRSLKPVNAVAGPSTAETSEYRKPFWVKQLRAGAKQIDMTLGFATGSAALNPRAKVTLDVMCQFVDKFVPRQRKIFVISHTDATGQEARNLALTLSRARAVKRHLNKACLLSDERVEAIGAGSLFPRPGMSKGDRRQRRLEVLIR